MKEYIYQNNLISKRQLRQLLAWSFTNYDSMQACALADELKYLGFKYATQAGISISIEDLKVPFVKQVMLQKANKQILNTEKIYSKGRITDVERFQKIIDIWSFTSESLKEQLIYYFKNYDPLNSVYIMAFSGARGNLSQVRQLVGMRGLMADPNGEILKLPIRKNFREGLTVTDYLMSSYGARKGIVDTALRTANSGYLTRRLIDVGQDILIREKDCLTKYSCLLLLNNKQTNKIIFKKIVGRILNKPVVDLVTNQLLAHAGAQITPKLVEIFQEKKITKLYIRSPFTCDLYRAICQKCYGWDLASEALIDIGEAIGILAGQSIGEPGTQLTMRTFHTGGVFKGGIRRKLTSPASGITCFHKSLKTAPLRTQIGKEVLIAKSSGSIILITEAKVAELIKIQIPQNTILFVRNKQTILKGSVIGELANNNKQVRNEIKPILSETSGEVFMPRLKKRINLFNNNKLVWILKGEFYEAPMSSFINYYPDYKLNKNSYVFRTKIINHYNGSVRATNNIKNLYQRLIKIANNKLSLFKTKLYRLKKSIQQKNYILSIQNLKYLFKVTEINSDVYMQLTHNKQIGLLLTNAFKTLTGGNLYYDYRNLQKCNQVNSQIFYFQQEDEEFNSEDEEFNSEDGEFNSEDGEFNSEDEEFNSNICYRTITWINEEVHRVDCDPNVLLVEEGDYISGNFELIPDVFSKTSGLVSIEQKNNFIRTISIKTGLVYEVGQFQHVLKKLYFPGEFIIPNLPITKLAFCEDATIKQTSRLLVRSVEIYELPHINKNTNLNQILKSQTIDLNFKFAYLYKPNQILKGIKNTTLISSVLMFELGLNKLLNNKDKIQLIPNKELNSIDFYFNEKLFLNTYIKPNLRYRNIQSSLLIQPNQFIDKYTIIGYLEAVTSSTLEIVQIKIKKTINKQLLLISNKDCLIVQKNQYPDKKLNDFIVGNKIGKVIAKSKDSLILQCGKPYFFPNCNIGVVENHTPIKYKIMPTDCNFSNSKTKKVISINYKNLTKLSVKKKNNTLKSFSSYFITRIEFSKLFLKLNNKLYSTLIPKFSKKFSLKNTKKNSKIEQLIYPYFSKYSFNKSSRTLLFKSSEIKKNPYTGIAELDSQIALVNFQKQQFLKTIKAVGLHSIVEDYFEEDSNSLFCKNNDFIEIGETMGFLSLEKEITSDIVQGLPKIEQILEARKKKLLKKNIPTSKKKGLLTQKTSLDPNFEFKKMGTVIKESEKINPHKLLKIYFNYYGLIKSFSCEKNEVIKYNRLIQNYEGSYKSFKKVQTFILTSVQSVYKSQGVAINDKHLEVVIKQMTTKVLITDEGNTPLLRREIIDLYHIQYINEIIRSQKKEIAYYVPLLLGITKASLNNPSFISAASFQETTKVLTKAAIEGRIDWLRGLKENIIIGHLIPAGTGFQSYHKCFRPQILSNNSSSNNK